MVTLYLHLICVCARPTASISHTFNNICSILSHQDIFLLLSVFIAFTTHSVHILSNDVLLRWKNTNFFYVIIFWMLFKFSKKKHEQKKYANIITSWIESSVEKRFIDDDNDELCCFLCVYASVTYSLYIVARLFKIEQCSWVLCPL